MINPKYFVVIIVFFISGCYTGDLNKLTPGKPVNFNASSVIGYRISRNTDLETHITEVSNITPGNGSFKDIRSNLYAAGKFRNIKYLSGNRWKCEELPHRNNLEYNPTGAWKRSILIMTDMNIFKTDDDVHYRY